MNRSWLFALAIFATSFLVAPAARAAPKPIIDVDHLMIGVSARAPERAALERAGFRIARNVNRHEGQGSASVTVELENGFLELAWRDDSVSVSPGLERVAERFQKASAWRTSGWSPFGLGLRSASGAPDSLPFPTRTVRAPWMDPGARIELVSPAIDTAGPRVWVVSPDMAADGSTTSRSERDRHSNPEGFLHPNHAQRITRVLVTAPPGGLTPTTDLVSRYGQIQFSLGSAWLLDVTFDRGVRHQTRDLRPELPLVVHF
jgi:hypothetical protein